MTVKPFYIRFTPDMTDAQVAEVFDKAVSAGAIIYEGVLGFHQCKEKYLPFDFTFFGVTEYLLTLFSYHDECFGQNSTEITLDQVDEWLGIAKQPTVAERMAALIEERKNKFSAWVRFLAISSDGDICVYSAKPEKSEYMFQQKEKWCVIGKIADDKERQFLAKHWRETLTEIKPAKAQEHDYGTIGTVDYNDLNDGMIKRDERSRSQAEEIYDLKIFDREMKKAVIKYRKQLKIPSNLPTEQAMPMMLGGEFGGVTDD